MKQYLILLLFVFALVSCKSETKENVESETTEMETQEIAYASFGEKISDADALSAIVMSERYAGMSTGDSVTTKMTAKVNEVCQAKGCWMTLELADGEEVMVKFKDYGFFMPKDIAGKEVIINGKAFVNEVPVEELRHYAEDAGKSAEEIAQITEPKKTYSFEADGVLLKQ